MSTCTKWLVALATVALACSPSWAFDFFEPVDPPRPFQVMVHRGAMGQAPENSRAALRRCIGDFFEWAEVDVRRTKDGHYVILHDQTVDRTTSGTGSISELTLGAVKDLDAGSWFASRYSRERILTLSECLEFAKGKINLYVDCKGVDPKRLAREILDADMARQVVVHGAPKLLAVVRKASKGRIPTMAKWRPENEKEEWLARCPVAAVEIDAGHVTREVCNWFHARDVKVQAKVLGGDSRPEVWDAVLDAGADWVQTDIPEEVIAHRLWKSLPKRPVMVAFHRGANRYAPENTIPAFEKAVRMGADYVEFDARTTTDGKFYILHDGSLDRTTNGMGSFAEHDSAHIQALDAGGWFGSPYKGLGLPSLDETMETLGGGADLYFDAKDISAEALSQKLVGAGLVEHTVVYDDVSSLAKLKAINSEIRLLCPLGDADEIEALCDELQPYAFDVSWKILSKELVERCHARKVKVFSDAMGRERIEEYQKAIGWGIDLIQTDQPLGVYRAVELLGSHSGH